MTFIADDARRANPLSSNRPSAFQRARLVERRAARSLLFASSGGKYESRALQHADSLARAMRVELHVVRVLTPHALSLSAFARALGLRRSGKPLQSEVHAAKRWCDEVLSESIPAERVHVCSGDFVEETARHSSTLDEPVIVLPPSTGSLGSTATALACASSHPVLVVRAEGVTSKVLAATDLHRDESWVVRQAVALGNQLGAPVVMLHNSSSISMAPVFASPSLAPLLPQPLLPASVGDYAVRAQSRSELPTIMTNEPNAAKAIIEQARARRVRTIVVGSSTRSWLERLMRPSIAAEIAQRADRSVLIAPRTEA